MISATLNNNGDRSVFEKTGPQNRISSVYGRYGYDAAAFIYRRTAWFEKVRCMRIEPTIAFLRTKFAAEVVAPGFAVVAHEEVPEEIVDFIRQTIGEVYEDTARSAAYGAIDYGNQPFEAVYKVDDGMIVIDKFKQLLQGFGFAVAGYQFTGAIDTQW